MIQNRTLFMSIYDAFNRGTVENVLPCLHPSVDWPNGWDGGRVMGRDAVKEHWQRQCAQIDAQVVPEQYSIESDGRIAVSVHQVVKDKQGGIISDDRVTHIYTIENDLVLAMEIRPPAISGK